MIQKTVKRVIRAPDRSINHSGEDGGNPIARKGVKDTVLKAEAKKIDQIGLFLR